MSGAQVWAVDGPAGRVVVKRTASLREAAVYGTLVPTLEAAGVTIPVCFDQVAAGGGIVWLILEHIPEPLPRDRWLGNPEVMAMLARLHALEVAALDTIPDPFRPSWSSAMTAAAAARFADPAIRRQLGRLREEAQPLFAPNHVISGDANAANWGVRDGEVVLMDWERIGRGHPALDVGVTVPGLGTPADFEDTAHAYNEVVAALAAGQRAGPATRVTPRELALAKAWSLVEFMAAPDDPDAPDDPAVGDDPAAATPARRRTDTAAWLVHALPDWLATLPS